MRPPSGGIWVALLLATSVSSAQEEAAASPFLPEDAGLVEALREGARGFARANGLALVEDGGASGRAGETRVLRYSAYRGTVRVAVRARPLDATSLFLEVTVAAESIGTSRLETTTGDAGAAVGRALSAAFARAREAPAVPPPQPEPAPGVAGRSPVGPLAVAPVSSSPSLLPAFLGGGIFLLGYGTAVVLALSYSDYDPNAAEDGWIPLLGPFLARTTLADKDLEDGWSLALIADGVLQVGGFALAAGGLISYLLAPKPRPGPTPAPYTVSIRRGAAVFGGAW